MRSFCLSLAKCRHDTLIQSKRKQQIAIFHPRYFPSDLKQSRSYTEGKWRDRMKNIVDVTCIVSCNCRNMAICCFLLLCIKVSWRHLANLKQMLRICALLALHLNCSRIIKKCNNFLTDQYFLMKLFTFYSTFDTLSHYTKKICKKSQILAFTKFFVCYSLLIKTLVVWVK